MTTVTWTQDVNGNYEVSSSQHLKQIMNKGSLYTDAGSAPTSYWEDVNSYIQTADIDLLNDTDLEKNIADLRPESSYTIRLYIDLGTGYVLSDTATTTTLANSGSNYVMEDFLIGDTYDLSNLDTISKSNIALNLNSLLTTGDKILISEKIKGTFVELNDFSVAEDNVVVPFNENSGASQYINLVLADASTVAVGYDESENKIEIESVMYGIGDVLILNGKKCSILEY